MLGCRVRKSLTDGVGFEQRPVRRISCADAWGETPRKREDKEQKLRGRSIHDRFKTQRLE